MRFQRWFLPRGVDTNAAQPLFWRRIGRTRSHAVGRPRANSLNVTPTGLEPTAASIASDPTSIHTAPFLVSTVMLPWGAHSRGYFRILLGNTVSMSDAPLNVRPCHTLLRACS